MCGEVSQSEREGKFVHVREVKCIEAVERRAQDGIDMSKSTRDNIMNGGVAVCYWPLLVENEALTFCLSSRDFCPGLHSTFLVGLVNARDLCPGLYKTLQFIVLKPTTFRGVLQAQDDCLKPCTCVSCNRNRECMHPLTGHDHNMRNRSLQNTTYLVCIGSR